MDGRRKGLSFAVAILLIGLASLGIAALFLLEALSIDRPDAQVIEYRLFGIGIPIFWLGVGLITYAGFLLLRR
jgi:hypothetical protein